MPPIRRARSLSVLALAISIAPVLVATTWPFEFDLRPEALQAKWARFEWVFFYDRAGTIVIDRDLLLNLLLLAPLGIAIALAHRSRPVWRVMLEAAAAALALSTGIELLQVLTPDRVSQLADIWRNTLGCLVAAGMTALVRRLHRRAEPGPTPATPHGSRLDRAEP